MFCELEFYKAAVGDITLPANKGRSGCMLWVALARPDRPLTDVLCNHPNVGFPDVFS
jgi:hypothetical protein